MTASPDINGLAALTICESLLLALNDHNILPEREIINVLRDAAATHQSAPKDAYSAEVHADVAALIIRIIDGGNSVRRP
jgi:hypothetical protein